MAIKSQAYESLAKKLAAVRSTLDDDERVLLDQIVRTANLEDEGARDVDAHGMTFSAASSYDAAAYDVDAHGMTLSTADSADAVASNVVSRPGVVFMKVYQSRARDDDPDVEAFEGRS